MRPQRTPMKPPRKPGHRHPNAPTDPVEVCARIRNLTNKNDESCIDVINDTTIRLTSSDNRVTECQFYKVFNQNVGQQHLFHYVAEHMVNDLVQGKSGLLFTYGVTSSGKTYTMTGTLEEPGFLPRCLDMLFNSVQGVQASKYVFVPDCMNTFCVQTEAEALLEKQERDILPQLSTPKTPSKSRSKIPDVRYELEHCQSENINPDCRYAVFVSYVEIYNDYIYDLLGEVQLDPFNRPRPPQSKRLREDKGKNMFVYGVTQVEVKSTEEAFAAFQQGQERRRIAHTQLNAESSRSHSIFNIRLVQAPLDPLGEDLLQEKSLICASQLSLVDLAGSERMARTGAGGERLREAGNINSSLMTLRRCLEQLRENQKNGTCEMVKYRNSKLTHLFKSYFEGHGRVKMVVCLNPNAQEYDENTHVVQFAEMAQQVEVARQEVFKIDRENVKRKALEAKTRAEEEKKRHLTAARQLSQEATGHRLHQRGRFKQITSSSESDTTTVTPSTTDDGESDGWEGLDFNIGSSFPNLEVIDPMDCDTIPSIISFLQDRMDMMNSVKKSVRSLGTMFRTNLSSNTQNDKDLQSRLKDCENELSTKSKDLAKMERQVKKLESKNQVLSRTTQVFEKDKKQLQDQLCEAEMQLKNSQLETRKVETKLRGTVANTKAQIEKQCEKRVRNVQTQMQEKMWVKDEQLRQLKHIITDGREPREGREGRPVTRRNLTPLPPATPTTSESSRSRLTHKRRSRSAENLLKETKSLNKSRHISNSDNDLRQQKMKKKSSSTSVAPVEGSIDQSPSRLQQHSSRMMTRSRKHCFTDSQSDTSLLEQENERTLGCKFVNRNDEEAFRHRPAAPLAPKHRRSKSGANGQWLAHLPSTTVPTETIMQPCIKPNRVVNVPSPKDVAGANKYLLTHQREDKHGEIETQLVKGEVFRTRTGGQQVQFVDIETLKQRDPKSKKQSPPRKRKSNTSVDELSSGEQSSWTDLETRCSYGITNQGVAKSAGKKKK